VKNHLLFACCRGARQPCSWAWFYASVNAGYSLGTADSNLPPGFGYVYTAEFGPRSGSCPLTGQICRFLFQLPLWQVSNLRRLDGRLRVDRAIKLRTVRNFSQRFLYARRAFNLC